MPQSDRHTLLFGHAVQVDLAETTLDGLDDGALGRAGRCGGGAEIEVAEISGRGETIGAGGLATTEEDRRRA